MKSNKKKRWLRVLAWTVGSIVILLLVIRMIAPGVAVKVANNILPDALNTEASIGDIDLSLLRGRVTIENIRIAQPEGFEGADLLEVERVSADVSMKSLFGSPIVVQNVLVKSPTIRISRDTNGVANAQALAPPADTNATTEIEAAQEQEGSTPPAVTLNHLRIDSLRVEYTDRAFGDDVIETAITDLNLEVTDVVFNPAAIGDKTMPGAVMLTARIEQPEPYADAVLGVVASLGVMGTNIPAVNAAIRLVGLELDTFDAAVPPGIASALGGGCLDLEVDLKMAVDVLDCDVRVISAGAKLPLHIGGTPRKPKPGVGGALFAVMGRFGGSIGNLAGNIGGVGLEAADAAVDTAFAAGKGAAKMVGSVGGGLFKVVKGAVSGDLSAMGAGLKQSTVGTVSDAIGTVSDTTSAAVGGIANTATASVTDEGGAKWRATASKRWDTGWAIVSTNVPALPYPAPGAAPQIDIEPVAAVNTNGVATATETNAPVKKPFRLVETEIDE